MDVLPANTHLRSLRVSPAGRVDITLALVASLLAAARASTSLRKLEAPYCNQHRAEIKKTEALLAARA